MSEFVRAWKGWGLLVLVGMLFDPVSRAQAQDPKQVVELLEKQRQTIRTLHQVAETTVEQDGHKRTSTEELWLQREGETYKQRFVKQLKPKGGKDKNQKAGPSSSLVVCDGEFTWTETKLEDRVLVIKSPSLTEDDFGGVRQAVETGQASLKPEQTINEEKCVVLEVRNGGGVRSTATYWISKRYGLQLKREMTTPDGRKTVVTTQQFEVNKPISQDKFSYTPPEGAQVLEMQAPAPGH